MSRSPLSSAGRRAAAALLTAALAACHGDDVTGPRPLPAFVVTPQLLTIVPGDTVTVSARMQQSDGELRRVRGVEWLSSDHAVATVSPAGLVTARDVGSVTITSVVGGRRAHATLSVATSLVRALALAPQSLTLVVGTQAGLVATATDAQGAELLGRRVTYASSNPGALAVDEAGVVSALAPGTAVVTATSEGRVATATITVVAQPASSIVITPKTASVPLYGLLQLGVNGTDAAGNPVPTTGAVFASLANEVATVSPAGLVTGVAQGTARIVVRLDGKADTAIVTVGAPVVHVLTIAQTAPRVPRYDTLVVAITARDIRGYELTGRPIVYTSSNPSVATVTPAGQIVGRGLGTATITAFADGASASLVVTVDQPRTVRIDFGLAGGVTLVEGASAQLTPVGYDVMGDPIVGKRLNFYSSSPVYVTVDADGRLYALRATPAPVQVVAYGDAASATAMVTVTAPPVASVGITPPATTILLGSSFRLSAVGYDFLGNALPGASFSWTSSDPTIATVDGAGQVTASTTRTGIVTITATSANGTFATASVTVRP